MRRSFAELRFSPRPASIRAVRRFVGTGSLAYVENLNGDVETREATGLFTVEWENSDQLSVGAVKSYEFLPEPFPIAPDVTIPVDGYDFTNLRLGYNFGQQRRFSANVTAEHGSFYGGRKTALGVSRGRVTITDPVLRRAVVVDQLDRSAPGRVHHEPGRHADDLYDDPPHVRERARAIQLAPQSGVGEHPLPVGVPARQRALRRLQRGPNTEMSRFPAFSNRAFIVKVNRLFRF